MKKVKDILLYRIIARLFPLKYKLNFLIHEYIDYKESIIIPYFNGFEICIIPNPGNIWTISDLIFEGPRYLPEYPLIEEIKQKLPKRFTYVDIGANIGTTVWLFAREAGKVYAFEPIPRLGDTIRNSIQVNGVSNVMLIGKAIGDREGNASMLDSDNSNVVLEGDVESLKVIINTLDSELVNAGMVDFIKIDVEGFEFSVLKGADNIIRTYRPRLLVEFHPSFVKKYGADGNLVIDFIEQRGYRISYYSFLNSQRFSKVGRFLTRFMKSGKRFNDKNAFLQDLQVKPELSSYHLYCEPQ